MHPTRRQFVAATAATAATTAALAIASPTPAKSADMATPAAPFKLNYAPHFGMFKHHAGEDLLDQLRFAHDQGFRAWEDNGMPKRPPDVQQKIGDTLRGLGMTMGVFVATGSFKDPTFAGDDKGLHDAVLKDIKASIDVAKRCGATWMTVVPGALHPKLPLDYQHANAIDLLRRCCDLLEPHGLVMVLEPLNRQVNHPGVLLHEIPQAYLLCRAVDSPSCKILDDLYHQQITEGNLIGHLDHAWDEIAYLQVGDHPGRKEPTTGEIHYQNVFKHLHRKGYEGVIGMEHGLSKGGKAGEQKLINAYRWADGFDA